MRFDKSILHLPWYKLYLSYLQRATTKKVVATVTFVKKPDLKRLPETTWFTLTHFNRRRCSQSLNEYWFQNIDKDNYIRKDELCSTLKFNGFVRRLTCQFRRFILVVARMRACGCLWNQNIYTTMMPSFGGVAIIPLTIITRQDTACMMLQWWQTEFYSPNVVPSWISPKPAKRWCD